MGPGGEEASHLLSSAARRPTCRCPVALSESFHPVSQPLERSPGLTEGRTCPQVDEADENALDGTKGRTSVGSGIGMSDSAEARIEDPEGGFSLNDALRLIVEPGGVPRTAATGQRLVAFRRTK